MPLLIATIPTVHGLGQAASSSESFLESIPVLAQIFVALKLFSGIYIVYEVARWLYQIVRTKSLKDSVQHHRKLLLLLVFVSSLLYPTLLVFYVHVFEDVINFFIGFANALLTRIG